MVDRARMDTSVNVVKGDLHPLQIPGVVENVMQYCKFQDLKNCRLVSKVWLDSSLKSFRSSARVKLTATEKPGSNMSDFIQFVNKKQNKHSERPYAEYSLTGMISRTMPLWEICGPHINILNFESCTFLNLEHFRTVIYTSCPNLKRLTFQNCGVRVRVIGGSISETRKLYRIPKPTAWEEPRFGENTQLVSLKLQKNLDSLRVSMMEIFSHFPSLKTLELEGRDRDLDKDELLFQAVEIIRQHDRNKLNLTSIKTWSDEKEGVDQNTITPVPVPAALVRVAADPSMKLEELSIGATEVHSFQRIRQIIWGNAGSLKKLTLFRPHPQNLRREAPGPRFPPPYGEELNKLEELTISCVFTNLEFLKLAPNLKTLKIYSCGGDSVSCPGVNLIEATSLEEMEGVVMTNCVKLDVAGIDLVEKDMEKLFFWFPNVEELTISLDNDFFRMVCEGWPNLRKLEVPSWSQVDACGLTGLDCDDVSEINADEEGDTDNCWRPITVPRANIAGLKNLRQLSLNVYSPLDFAGIRGILEAPQLTSVTIKSYEVWSDMEELKLMLMSKIAICNLSSMRGRSRRRSPVDFSCFSTCLN